MQATLSRWGNSLGLRIPKQLALQMGLAEGAQVELSVDEDRIIISLPRAHYRLDDLLIGMTPEAMHEAFDWGPDRGREVIDGK